jgi:hypothetical protein
MMTWKGYDSDWTTLNMLLQHYPGQPYLFKT